MKNYVSFGAAFSACFIMALNTGCASGGFQLTRSFAGWINSIGSPVIRVILYILTIVVFVVTLLIDLVINNTIDFWNGTLAQGTYKFERDGKSYVAHHEILPGTKLKRSTITVMDSNNKLLQEVILKETPSGEVELYVDGKIRTRVQNISKLPLMSMYDQSGRKVEEKVLRFDTALAVK